MPPDLQPTLTGKKILIRPLRETDWPELFAAASDPKIWEVHPAPHRYQEKVFRDFFDGAMRSGSAFAFVERDSGAVVGSSRYHGFKPESGEIEIGWTFLVRRLWGGGVNREIKRLMLAHAFTFVDTVVFFVGETNWRSRRAMEKIGGVPRPQMESRPPMGPHVIYEITKAGFAANPFWQGEECFAEGERNGPVDHFE
jgi:RimJ/RimL family protein N-acetyltransferase